MDEPKSDVKLVLPYKATPTSEWFAHLSDGERTLIGLLRLGFVVGQIFGWILAQDGNASDSRLGCALLVGSVLLLIVSGLIRLRGTIRALHD